MKVWSNSLIYLKLYFRSVRNPRFWKLPDIDVEVKLETKISSFNLMKLVWVLASVFHFWSKHQQLGFGSSQHSCFLWQTTNCFPICIPEVISVLEFISISWTICVGKHGNVPKQLHSWGHFHAWGQFHFLDISCWQAWKWTQADSEWHDSSRVSRISSRLNNCNFVVTQVGILSWSAKNNGCQSQNARFGWQPGQNGKWRKNVRSDSYSDSDSRAKCSVTSSLFRILHFGPTK